MPGSILPAACRIRILLVSIILVFVAAGCKVDEKTEGGEGLERTRVVDQRSARFLLDAQHAFESGDVGAALALADSAEQSATAPGGLFLADVNFLRGRIHSELNNADAAQQAYERVLALVPDYQGAHLNLGNNAFRSGQYRRALRHYEREAGALDDPRVQVYIGRAYVELGRVDSARLAFEAAIAQSDSFAEAHARLAYLFQQDGDVEQGLPHARRAVEQQPDNADYRYLVASMLLRKGEVERAADEFRQVVARDPRQSKGYFGLGRALANLGQTEEASRFLRIADSLKHVEDGLREYETKTRLYPDDPAAWATYGYALNQAGRDADAMQAFQTVLSMDPENVEVRFGVANLFLEHGDFKRALGEYNAVLQHDESFVPAWINAGIALARIGQRDAARVSWQTALRHDPGNEVAREYLAGLPPPP